MNLLTRQEGLNYRLEGKLLHLEPPTSVKDCSWSVFDITGTEKFNGKFTGEVESVVDVSSLKPGVYEICLMDGERLRSARFRVQ